eukprot:GDKJ01061227.1.p1 GENE.GDKJ01061227.1~~GDKJ01061227.1.p1  ORF type:complete len:274 (-),score=52.93 GDKJ01061227.1:99-920(-)
MFLSGFRAAPPKLKRNNFFPWTTFTLHRSGQFVERNRVVFKVPVNQTKAEIRQFLRKVYDMKVLKVNTSVKIYEVRRNLQDSRLGYYRAGPMHKRAFVTTEEAIPDQVKMMGGSLGGANKLMRNPSITKKHLRYGIGKEVDPAIPNKSNWHKVGSLNRRKTGMDTDEKLWKTELPTLLAGDEWNLNPVYKAQEWEEWMQMRPDVSKPFMHSGVSLKPGPLKSILGLPDQKFEQIELAPWRKTVDRIKRANTVKPNLKSGGVAAARPSNFEPPS